MTTDPGRQGADRTTRCGGASAHSRDRLGAELSSEVAATRAAWNDALLRSDAALRHGRPEDAREALDDQRRLLVQLQQRLDRAVSSALVEREAETVLRGAAPATHQDTPSVDQRPQAPHDPTRPAPASTSEAVTGRWQQLPRILAGVAAAVAMGLVATLPGPAATPTPEIAAMAESHAEQGELPATDDGYDDAAPPADELRHLAPWAPKSDATAAEVAAAQPDDASPVQHADTPVAEEEPGTERPEADEPHRRKAPEAGATEPSPEPAADEADDPGDGDEDEDRDEGLRDRLPRLDRALTQRLGEDLGEFGQH